MRSLREFATWLLALSNALEDAVSFFNEKNINRILPALEYIESHYHENIDLEAVSKLLNDIAPIENLTALGAAFVFLVVEFV